MTLSVLSEATGFEWDEYNSKKNQDAHGVEPGECEELFFNQPLLVVEDRKHSGMEPRFHAMGASDSGRKMLAVFTLRGSKIRVISVRDMSRKERAIYENKES